MSRALAPCKKFIELGADIKQYIIQRYGVGARYVIPWCSVGNQLTITEQLFQMTDEARIPFTTAV